MASASCGSRRLSRSRKGYTCAGPLPWRVRGGGFAVTLAGVLLGLLGVPAGLLVCAALAFAAAFLNAAFGLCIGCRLHVLLIRARVIRAA